MYREGSEEAETVKVKGTQAFLVEVSVPLHCELKEMSELRGVLMRDIVEAGIRMKLSEMNKTTDIDNALHRSAGILGRDYDQLKQQTKQARLDKLSPSQAASLYYYNFLDMNDRLKVFEVLGLKEAFDQIEDIEAFYVKAKTYQETFFGREWRGEFNLTTLRRFYEKERRRKPLTRVQEEYSKRYFGEKWEQVKRAAGLIMESDLEVIEAERQLARARKAEQAGKVQQPESEGLTGKPQSEPSEAQPEEAPVEVTVHEGDETGESAEADEGNPSVKEAAVERIRKGTLEAQIEAPVKGVPVKVGVKATP